MRLPFLLSFLCLCIVLAVIIELLVRSCALHGCRVFGPSPTRLSSTTDFIYNYLPTILAVAFNLLWGAANHDFQHLETPFQLSRSGGATALLLEYLYLFPLLVPVHAFRRGSVGALYGPCERD